jgi:hypothetical protein
MKCLTLSLLSFALSAFAAKDSPDKLRVLAYNVACGQWATPEQIAEVLKSLNPDIVLLSEEPKANRGKKVKDWSHRLAEALELDHVEVGTVSSANHKAPNWGMSPVIMAASSSPFLAGLHLRRVRTTYRKGVDGNEQVPFA